MTTRTEINFPSGADQCAAWLYRPSGRAPYPCVILAHGLGLVREAGLEPYAERFVGAGYAALVFDYRHFGASTGQPRQLLDIDRQLEDWASAVRFVRALPDLDTERIVLWGTSFAGGHVIETAARDGRAAAVIGQCPFTDGRASVAAIPLLTNLRLARVALLDELRRVIGRPPLRIPLVAAPGEVALMTAADAQPGYRALIPPDLTFDDAVAARIALKIGLYRPGRSAERVRCPMLLCVCDQDSVAPPGPSRRAGRCAPLGEVRSYPRGHFEIYSGEAFEEVISDQLEFLRRHLRPSAPEPGARANQPEPGAA